MAVVPFLTPKHAPHLQPILDALPEIVGEDIALVASYGSLVMAKRRGFRRIVLAQHGAGQSYGGDTHSARNPGYPGGDKNDAVGLFLCPNEYSAERWRQRYPEALVAVVGCLRTLPAKEPGPVTVACSWHWDAYLSPEANSAFEEYAKAFAALPWPLIGTGHPQRYDLRAKYEALGVEYVPDLEEVARRADLLVFDNTSSGYEWANSGRPVVVLNAKAYRRNVWHGGRYWSWESVGPVVNHPADLADAVEVALSGPWLDREAVLSEVYQPREDGPRLAAEAIVAWAA